MASSQARKNKDGIIISYQIKVARGRDPLTKKQRKPYTMTWTPPRGWSERAIRRELNKVMGEFEAACNRGEVLTKEESNALAIKKEQEEKYALTFSEYAKIYLENRKPEIARNTHRIYKQALNRMADFIGDMKMRDIDPQLLVKCFSNLGNVKNKTRPKEKLSYSSIMTVYRALKVMFETATMDGIIDDNPVRKMKRPKQNKEEKRETKAYSEKEVAKIIELLENEPLMWRAYVLLLIDSGMRRGEAIGLDWSDINFETQEVSISKNAQPIAGEKTCYIAKPKNGKTRTVYLTQLSLSVLDEWRKQQKKELFKMGARNRGYCFTSKNGDRLSPNFVNNYFIAFSKKYSMPGFHPHKLRHTWATITIANGGDIVSVSEALGHSSPAITLNVYSHANEEARRRASQAFEEALKKANA